LRKIKFNQSVKEALTLSMLRDKKVVLMGLGVTDPKGIFGTTKDLGKKFGSTRVIETPTSENAITGIALGAAIKGMRPILTHQRVEFSLLSMEQIVNQLSKWHFMSAGKQKVPIVIRMIIGKGWGQGPQHSQSLEVLFSHIPGLKVVAPSNAFDAKGLLIQSIKDNNPVIFFEHRWLHDISGNVPKKSYDIKIGKAKIIKKGKDITIVSFSEAIVQVMRIYKFLKINGIEPEIIDLRTLRPIDKKTIINSVKKTRKLLVIDNSWTTYGISAEIISIVTESIFKKLKKSPQRIGIKNVMIPSSKELAKHCYLNSKNILEKIISITGKNINKKKKNLFLKKINTSESDIPYKDFKGPF
tara:strand:+ start:535 stop:1602 length:1068 start_codon:yes stop_codon:yes gene_type:complete